MPAPLPRAAFPRPRSLLLLALASACGGSGSGGSEVIGGLVVQPSRTTSFACPAGTPLAMGDEVLAFLAQESAQGAGGTDLNGDGDATDLVAVAVDLATRDETPLRAASDVLVVDDEVYLLTFESQDGQDWNGNLANDLVLLHWSVATQTVALVDTLQRDDVVRAGGRLFYSAGPDLVLQALETTLRFVDAAAPTTPVMVAAADASVAGDPVLLRAEEDLVFLGQDETAESPSRDLNDDGDDDDESVLALVDATDAAPVVRSVGLAVQTSAPPFCAAALAAGDWLVGFLVCEADQGSDNLNDPALFDPSWQPTQCAGLEDNDDDDRVLFYLEFAAWATDALASPPVNTGLVGDGRVFAALDPASTRAFVGTISPEADEGDCSLNGDGDQADDVVRWVEVLAGGTFDAPGDAADLLAIRTVAGGVRGVLVVDGRFVAVVSEAEDDRDHDGDPSRDDDILGWLDPAALATTSWTFPDHVQTGTPLGVDWLARDASGAGFFFTDREEVIGLACNAGDDDEEDSFGVFGRFDPNDLDELQWNGYCVAVEPFNAGAVRVDDTVFVRVDEEEEDSDLNEDGDMQDQILLCHTVFPLGQLRHVGTLNDVAGPAVARGTGDTVAFVADEAQARRDYNEDGDMLDHVVRTVRAH